MNKRYILALAALLLLAGCRAEQLPVPEEKPDVPPQEQIILEADRSQVARATLELRGETLYKPVDCPEALLEPLLAALEGTYLPISYNASMVDAGSPSQLTVRLYGGEGALLEARTFSAETWLLLDGSFCYQKGDDSLAALMPGVLDSFIRHRPPTADAAPYELALVSSGLGQVLLQDYPTGQEGAAPVEVPPARLDELTAALNGSWQPYDPGGVPADLGDGKIAIQFPEAKGETPELLFITYSGLLDAGTRCYYTKPDSGLVSLLREILGKGAVS